MQTKTASQFSHEFVQNKSSYNETTLASIWAILSFISLVFFAFNI